jgi:hypothetical protein
MYIYSFFNGRPYIRYVYIYDNAPHTQGRIGKMKRVVIITSIKEDASVMSMHKEHRNQYVLRLETETDFDKITYVRRI